MTETTPLAASTADAATERLAGWVIGALTVIVIGGVALAIYGPHGGHARGSSLAARDQRVAERHGDRDLTAHQLKLSQLAR